MLYNIYDTENSYSEREVIMYYHFSTTSSLPFSKGEVASNLATIGLEASSEETELDFHKSYCSDGVTKIPLYIESSIDEDKYTAIQNNIISVKRNTKAVLLVDDLDFFMTLLHDSRFQHPEEELEGSFCILDNMTIHWISDDNNVVLATIQEWKDD